MPKKLLFLAIICLIVAGTLLFLCLGRRPYRDLQASDIASATVRLSPPDETVQITELKELVELLNDLVIYHRDFSYTQYAGQAAIFTLTMTDGSQHEIAAFQPFLIIDGKGYRTKYEPCEQLNRYANELLSKSS